MVSSSLRRAVLGAACAPAVPSIPAVSAQSHYNLTRTYDTSPENDFFSAFNFRDRAYFQETNGVNDLTNGFVNYLSKTQAQSDGLAGYRDGKIYLGADSSKTLSTNDVGRDSVRLEGKDTFDTGLLVADIEHMPGNSCGIWPAYWLYNFAENPYSEIDILEGTGDTAQSENSISLFTCTKCSFNFDGGSQMTGVDFAERPNCNMGDQCYNDPTNVDGCGMTGAEGTKSYGDKFNSVKGGYYVTQIEDEGLKIWFFPRASAPKDLVNGNPDPSGWSKPMGNFPTSNSCDVPGIFKQNSIIINIAFCGDSIWDWSTQGGEQCKPAASCEARVAAHPEDYGEAYFLFNSIKLYQRS